MLKRIIRFTALLLLLNVSVVTAVASVRQKESAKLLNIPAREQWKNDNGYCGETSIQTDALYYGTYVSQNLARKIAGGELLIGENDTKLLKALSLKYEEWDYNKPTPQYKSYLVFVKSNLNKGYPVVITVYVKGSTDPDYDHIIPAVGYKASSVGTYNESDELIFNDNFSDTPYTRTFGSLWSTRKIKTDTSDDYFIPRDVDYGVAITGIVDKKHETYPVFLTVDSWNEPNVTQGKIPKDVNAAIHIDSLTPGGKYILLKYTDYKKVPESDFEKNSSSADKVTTFIAYGSSATLYDSFMSDTLAVYRCVKAE